MAKSTYLGDDAKVRCTAKLKVSIKYRYVSSLRRSATFVGSY
jgi:hypothetical protein